MNQKLNKLCKTLAVAAAVGATATALAQPSAHYAPGLEGLKAATLPPPGVYLRDYNLFYYADQMNDSKGHEVKGMNPEAFIYANAPRVLWVTDYKLLGGYIGFDALIPLQYTSLKADIGRSYDDSTFGIGDFFGEATWSWHQPKFDAAIGYGIWAPTGDTSASYPTTRAGLGYWTHMFTAGATFYPDGEKQWALSALNRYEINTEKQDTHSTVGDVWTIEGGLSRSLSKTVDLGPVAYYQRQVESGKGNYPTVARDWVAAAGGEVAVFYPRVTFGWSLRYLYEFAAENRLQGHTMVLTMTKRF